LYVLSFFLRYVFVPLCCRLEIFWSLLVRSSDALPQLCGGGGVVLANPCRDACCSQPAPCRLSLALLLLFQDSTCGGSI